MYIILKGKISVYITLDGKEDIETLIAMPGDGECFGELSLFDFNKIHVRNSNQNSQSHDQQTREGEMNDQRILASSGLANIAPDVKKRGGTCTAVEDTICLMVDHATARKIL
jgi:CRP-like cAMP-binding protein